MSFNILKVKILFAFYERAAAAAAVELYNRMLWMGCNPSQRQSVLDNLQIDFFLTHKNCVEACAYTLLCVLSL